MISNAMLRFSWLSLPAMDFYCAFPARFADLAYYLVLSPWEGQVLDLMMEGNNSSLSFDTLNAWSSCCLLEVFSSYKLSMAHFCISVNFCISSVLELRDILNTPGSVSP